MKKLIALLLALVMLLSLAACGKTDVKEESEAPSEAASQADPTAADDGIMDVSEVNTWEDAMNYFKQFDEPFELHLAFEIEPTIDGTLEGNDTVEDNHYTRFLLENYNIKIVYDWTASSADYNQKLAMSIASDTLPDAWVCAPQYWRSAAKNGQLRDITEDYEKWVHPGIKQTYAPAIDTIIEGCSYDGALTCLTKTTVTTEGCSVLMINQDWLDQLGLEVPKTLDDVANVARAFKEAKLAGDATVPILGASNTNRLYSTFMASSDTTLGLDAVFAAHDAYPGYFYADENGEIVYGSLTDETREALILLNEWYEEGLLDQEIGIRTNGREPINANTCGMFFGSWWNIGSGNASGLLNDENADWRSYPIYTDDGKFQTKLPDVTSGVRFCISADATDEAALAAFVCLNTSRADTTGEYLNTGESHALIPLRLPMTPANYVDVGREHCLAVLEGTEAVDLYKGDAVYNEVWLSSQYIKEIIPNYTPGQELSRDDFVIDDSMKFKFPYAWIMGNAAFATTERDKEVLPAISYMTESMEMYWDNLESVEKSVMLAVITGEKDISAFDEFVEQWYAEGGSTILAEVAAEVA